MASFRRHLSYANVVSTIALFLVLGGASAFAANQLGKSSVGVRQLRAGAVTGAKLADGAVSAGKLADGVVSSQKLADGAVTGAKIAKGAVSADKIDPAALAALPVVHRMTSTAIVEFPPSRNVPTPVPYPFPEGTFIQPAGEDELLVASIQVHVPAACKNVRTADARLLMDTGRNRTIDEFLGRAILEENGSGEGNFTAQFVGGEISHGIVIPAPAVATKHSFSVELDLSGCNGAGGVPSGITATGVTVDAIGLR